MAETPSSSAPTDLLSTLPISAASHEAVDRLIAMATEKRADRIPEAKAAPPGKPRAVLLRPDARLDLQPEAGRMAASGSGSAAHPDGRDSEKQSASAAQTAVRLLSMLRPLLPALAGALRLVDHGAVQAAARLLPLLAGIPMGGSQAPAAEPAPALEAAHRQLKKDIDEVALGLSRLEAQLTQLRWKNAQLDSEQTVASERLRELASRVRLLTYAVILMLPMMVALVVLLVLHLRT